MARSGTRVWVCEPRQVWIAATCLGWSRLLMSKMRTPLKRSGLTASVGISVPQSTRPLGISTDMKSRCW